MTPWDLLLYALALVPALAVLALLVNLVALSIIRTRWPLEAAPLPTRKARR